MIDPGGIPTIPGDMDELAGHAAALRGVGSDFATTGQRINTTWQGLGGVYRAPEIGQLLAATAPVQMISASVSADIGTVAGALSGYAAEVRQIQAELASLRSQASEFVASVAGHDDWTSDGGKVDHNNQLISAVDAQLAAFFDAQRRCANTINALYGGPRYRAEGGDGQLRDGEYGYTAEALGAAAGQHGALPWGTTEEKDRGLLGDIGAFFGGVKDGAVGFVTGLGALIGRDPSTGKWSWDTAGDAWKGVGTLVLAAGVYAIPGGMRFDQTIGVPGLGRGALGETLTNAGKAIIAYDEWGKDPARAAGMATFNIVSAVVGTKGASAGLRAIGTAARDSRLATVSTAGTVMVRGGEAIGKLPTVSDLTRSAVQRIPGLHLPNLADTSHIHIPHHTDIPTPHTHGDLATSHPHLDLADATPRAGSIGDALSHTPRLPPQTPPHLAVPGHHTEIPAPHSDVPGRHTDVPSQRTTGTAPTNVSAHANAPAEGHASGPPSGVHPNPAEPAPTHAAHDAPGGYQHATDAPDPHSRDVAAHGLDAPVTGRNLGTQPDGSWIGEEHGHRMTLDPAANAKTDRILEQSAAHEPRISAAVKDVIAHIDHAKPQGWDFRLKGEGSLKRKIFGDLMETPHPDKVLSNLNDNIRYTMELPPSHYAEGVRQAIEQLKAHGFQEVKLKNFWSRNLGIDDYKGINSVWRDPATGQTFEMQWHTQASFEAKEWAHQYYEVARMPGATDAEVAAAKAKAAETFRELTDPPGATQIKEIS